MGCGLKKGQTGTCNNELRLNGTWGKNWNLLLSLTTSVPWVTCRKSLCPVLQRCTCIWSRAGRSRRGSGRRSAKAAAAPVTWMSQWVSTDVCKLLQCTAPCTHIQSLRTIAPALPLLSKFYSNYIMWPMFTQNHTAYEIGTSALG